MWCGPGLGKLPKIWGFPFNISATAEANDFKFGLQFGFAKAYRKITPKGKSGHGLGIEQLPKILWFHFNIYITVEARDFDLVHRMGSPRPTINPHPEEKWARPWAREAPIYLGFSFNISATAALSS